MNRLLRPFRRIWLAAAALALLAAPASAQNNQDTYVFLVTVATKGFQCDLLKAWEAAAIATQSDRFLAQFPADQQEAMVTAAGNTAEATPCNDAAMNEWINASRLGLVREWLPPNLALFRSLATMDNPPAEFTDVVGGVNLERAVEVIDAQIDEFRLLGVRAEGGVGWDEYLTQVDDAAADLVASLNTEDGPYPPGPANDFIVTATLVVTLWLDDEGAFDE